VWVVNAMPRPLYPREGDAVPIVDEAGWDPWPVWTGAENLAPPPGFDPWTLQPITIRYTKLSRSIFIQYNGELG